MKKVLFIAITSALVLSCADKKVSTYEQDSNIMLPEPEVKEVKADTTASPKQDSAVAQ